MPEPNHPVPVHVVLEPTGRYAAVTPGSSILDAIRQAGVEIVAVCGGRGTCQTCIVQVLEGNPSPLSPEEKALFTEKQVAQGYRLACRTAISNRTRVFIPSESLSAHQRLQVEGRGEDVQPDSPIKAVDVDIPPPNLQDLRSDETKLKETLEASGLRNTRISLPVLAEASLALRRLSWSVRAVIDRIGPEPRLVTVLPRETRVLGLAFDVGTTKLAGYLVDLVSGDIIARSGAVNPQVVFGDDVISRISYANEGEEQRRTLQFRLAATLNELVETLCREAAVERAQIADAVVVGNTAMHHLFAGLPVRPLGEAPYVPVVTDSIDAPAVDMGLHLAPGVNVHLPPNVAGYVGADHVAMLIASDAVAKGHTAIALDIGTNTEISLITERGIWSCSCASGPAFEGAHIENGMRAVRGAIERVGYRDGEFHVKTIGDCPPVGLCGSGILDAVSALRQAGLLDARGRFTGNDPRIHSANGRAEFVLVPESEAGHGKDVIVTRADVHEIQLAKAAIRSGIEILLAEADLGYDELDLVIVAGAFGTYLSLESAKRIGMFPPLPTDRFQQIGNAAGLGAVQLLLSETKRAAARRLARSIHYVELTTHAGFHDTYVESLLL